MIPCPAILGVSLVFIGLQLPPLWHAVPSTSNLVTLPPPQAIGPFVYIIKILSGQIIFICLSPLLQNTF